MERGRALIVEDDDLLRGVLSDWLLRDGFDVESVDTGQAALARVSNDPDVILLDYKLPDIDGFEVLRRLKRQRSEQPVVMLTGHASVPHAIEAMKHGAFHYLPKPTSLEQVSDILGQAVQANRKRGSVPVITQLADASDPSDPTAAILGRSPPIAKVRALIRRLGRRSSATVLITGESGTGKDLAARALHACSPRARGPFVNITCTALPPTLLESELFGHERGAFTDAKARHHGLLEQAEGGTVFLDEIGDMDLSVQSKLLHVLEHKTYRRVGGTRDLTADVRVVAATHVDLPAAVSDARFRADLYYRLAVLIVRMPTLRERPEDIGDLAAHFAERFARELGDPPPRLPEGVVSRLCRHGWPGNVRELKNVIERAVILSEGGDLTEEEDVQLSPPPRSNGTGFLLPATGVDLRAMERDLVVQALESTGGNVTRAATLLGMNRDQVRYRVQKFGLRDPER